MTEEGHVGAVHPQGPWPSLPAVGQDSPPLQGEVAPAPVSPLAVSFQTCLWICGVTTSRAFPGPGHVTRAGCKLREGSIRPSRCQETQVVGTGVNRGVYAATKEGTSSLGQL